MTEPTPAEIVHACPPDGSGLTPLELPRGDRITNNSDAVTCTTPAPAQVDEALAQRVARALREADTHWCGYGEGADHPELARAVLAALAPELARVPLICSDERHQAKVTALEATLARVRELHRRASDGDTCVYCAPMQRLGYDTTWPCDTIRALDTPAPDADRPPTARADAAVAALAEILAAVRTYRDADTGQPIHVPGRITPEQYQRWQRIAHPTKEA